MTFHPVLAIDTSGSFCSVAVRTIAGAVHVCSSEGDGDHFEKLPTLVRRVCDEAAIAIAALKEIRIGTGPGSFTGLRIGMSFAKGLSIAIRAPLCGISSFAGLAWSAADESGPVAELIVVSDARRDEVFIARYELGPGGPREVLSPCIQPIAGVLADSTVASARVYTPLRDFNLPGIRVISSSNVAPGLLRCKGDNHLYSVEKMASIEPHYVRGVSAKSIEERRGG